MPKTHTLTSAAVVTLSLLAAVALPVAAKSKAAKREAKREKIDTMAQETLAQLFEDSPKAKELEGSAYGWAVFNNLKVSLGITGGGGSGVAVERESGKRTYMKMGTAGLNVGLGGQKYQVVFLFEDQQSFRNFVDKGWQAEASANAVAGGEGANTQAKFTNGLAAFQLTETGLMLQADISGTKYWKDDDLNAE